MSDDDKKKHLRLVVNNEPAFRIKTPLERLKEEHQAVLEEKEEEYDEALEEKENEYNKEAENLRQEHAKELKEERWYTKVGFAVMIGVTISALWASKYGCNSTLEEIIQLNEDLNKDGINDAYILQKNGYKNAWAACPYKMDSRILSIF